MPRLSRNETRTLNRERVLASARTLFLRDGYQATSLAAIADEAGFSTGVVYSNFSGKAALGLLVLREIQTEQFVLLRDAVAGADSLDARLDAVQRWGETALDSGWPRLELEFALDARTESGLVAEEAQRHRAATDLMADTLKELLPDTFADLVPVRAAAEALMNLSYGFAVRRLIDPSVTVESLLKPLRESLRSLGQLD